jgi:hypothetical protein
MSDQGIGRTTSNDALLFDYLGSRLVALCGVYVPVGEAGAPEGPQRGFSNSGFVIELDETWYFVTAGHVLGEIGDHIGSGRMRLDHCNLADYFGGNAKNHHPTVISYEGTPKFYVDDWRLGLDVGALQLGQFYIDGLKSNGVDAIPEAQWLAGDATNERQFLILGLPEEEKNRENGDSVVEHVRPCIAGVTPCNLPEDEPLPPNPIFVGRLNSNEPDSMVGFSGGPIFRLRQGKNGLQLWLHALQVRWRKSERLVMGCPMTVAARLIRENLGNRRTPDVP